MLPVAVDESLGSFLGGAAQAAELLEEISPVIQEEAEGETSPTLEDIDMLIVRPSVSANCFSRTGRASTKLC